MQLVQPPVTTDVNLDGLPDVVAVAHYAGRLLYWPNLGNMEFGPGVELYWVNNKLGSVAVGDFNNDGLEDLVVGTRSIPIKLLVHLPAPAVTYAAPVDISVTTAPQFQGITVYDMNGDGVMDVMVSISGAPWGWILLMNDGTGLFTETVFSQRQPYYGVSAADYNGDGFVDVVAPALPGATWNILYNDGSNTSFTASPIATSVYLDTLRDGRVTGARGQQPPDFNGDGLPDIAFMHVVAFNDGAGGFTYGEPFKAVEYQYGTYADIDLDGDLDILQRFSSGSGGVHLYRNHGNGTFADPELVMSWAVLRHMHTVDLDLDGDLDLVFTGDPGGGSSDSIGVMENREGVFRTTCVDPAGDCLGGVDDIKPLELANITYTGCPSTHVATPILPRGAPLVVTTDPGYGRGARATIDCGHTGVLFSAVATAALRLEGIDLLRMSSSFAAVPQPGLLVASAGSMHLHNVSIADSTTQLTFAGTDLLSSTVCGGAVLVSGPSKLTVTDSTFARNTASASGGAVCLAPQLGVPGTPTFDTYRTLFDGNASPAGAGGHVAVVVASNERGAVARLHDCEMVGGRANFGGAAAVYVDTILVSGSSDAADLTPEPSAAAASLAAASHSPGLIIDAATRVGNDHAATFGDLFFACSAVVTLDASVSGTWDASEPPVFICIPASGVAPVPGWVKGTGVTGVLASGWSPPAVAVVDDAATSIMAGGSLKVVVRVESVFGLPYTLPSTLVGVDIDTLAPAECAAVIARRITDSIVGASGTPLAITVSAFNASCLGHVHRMRAGVVTALAAPFMFATHGPLSTSFDVVLAPCAAGFGPASIEPFGCSPCAKGTYTDGSFDGTESCLLFPACPANTVRGEAPESQASTPPTCYCVPGTYSPTLAADTTCIPCPIGAACDGGLARPRSLPGWIDISNTTGRVVQIEACPRPSSCAGDSNCFPGATGFMCTACASGYYTHSNGACAKCTDGMVTMFWIFITIAFVGVIAAVVGAVLAASSSMAPAVVVGSEEAWARSRVLAVVAQTALVWPTPMRETLESLAMLNFSLAYVGGECVLLSFTTTYKFTVVAPGALIVLTALVAPLLKLCTSRVPSVGLVVERVVFSAGPVLYIASSHAALQLFDCSRLPTGDYVLDADLGFKCFTPQWLALLPWALVAVFVYVVGLPAFMALSLYRARHRLASPDVRARYGLLYRLYKPVFYQFEVLLLFKRLAIVMAVMFFSRIVVWLMTTLVGVFSVFAAVQLKYAPFVADVYNVLETRLNVALLIILSIGAAFWANDFPDDGSYATFAVLGMAVIVVSFVLILHVALRELAWSRRHSFRAVAEADARHKPDSPSTTFELVEWSGASSTSPFSDSPQPLPDQSSSSSYSASSSSLASCSVQTADRTLPASRGATRRASSTAYGRSGRRSVAVVSDRS
ncbi:uncharacterized protein AMSG_10743 [Thecamonas trahens ATCC 50062]|uniref:DUF7630 domain-containing protein n=1 Tax=Thecamonas trahens ATCC 50062 TaxID=461836 RepID=A0A0L0DSF4_THETB|nr:hypothetical protein AMSG_10743 [Thecamonas trahens ATCC 50062]KNC55137.1 hypothetical protein AMSG_10743 [Thecamonas trahens ATCC 50062]|eukprot:XP_013753316.1 hypothetical protein AMSG_10743 [Thecamonas trahens ATCC 50062]